MLSYKDRKSLIEPFFGVLVLPEVFPQLLQHHLHLLVHPLHLSGLILAELHQPVLHVESLLLFLLVRLLLLEKAVQLGNPLF